MMASGLTLLLAPSMGWYATGSLLAPSMGWYATGSCHLARPLGMPRAPQPIGSADADELRAARAADARAANILKGAAANARAAAAAAANAEAKLRLRNKKLESLLMEADVERRIEEEAITAREQAVGRARQERQRKVALLNDIPENMPAGTVDDYMFKEGVKDILEKLDYDLIGLKPVKSRVREIASLLVVDKMRLKLGLETGVPSLHMGFTGAPGTGKTTVALRMGQILQRMGYCRTGHVVVATRDDLVGQYVGHTAPKTKEMVKKAMGGILLVDEAYYLYNAANDRDYGQESIEILLNVMENNKEDLIVVLAGYQDKMERFYSYIPGMESRIGNHIAFPNYEVDELVEIGKVMCRELEYTMDADAVAALGEYMKKRIGMPFFANARTIRNAIDLARMRAAIRVFHEKTHPSSDGMVSEQDLMTITAADFPTPQELEDDSHAPG